MCVENGVNRNGLYLKSSDTNKLKKKKKNLVLKGNTYNNFCTDTGHNKANDVNVYSTALVIRTLSRKKLIHSIQKYKCLKY